MDKFELVAGDTSDKTMVILQSLLCLMREKNLLTRADVEELCEKVQARVAEKDLGPLSCCPEGALAAASEMEKIGHYIGRTYGGKHRRN